MIQLVVGFALGVFCGLSLALVILIVMAIRLGDDKPKRLTVTPLVPPGFN